MTEQEQQLLQQRLHKLESFEAGMSVALVALKAAIQASPGFNQTALEDCVTFFLANPAANVDPVEFAFPLKTLLQDPTALLKELHYPG
ncbi:hypothetical protein [Caballeronia sp. dw_276]|uniref:hypothetical protein n=1 Tax=Caballeronia sp. dw_276 TaxID=2719795 RepID=UPI001BD3EBF0|nr:hypothetical protein [Caballeronia sp. dw_276]